MSAPAVAAAALPPRWRRYLPLAAFALLALLLGVGLTLKPREVPSPFIGKPAPAFSLPVLADPARSFAPESMRGQVWLLNVWASWCAPCRVGLNYKDDPRNAQEWLLRLGDPYRATAMDRDGRTGIDWGVYGVPETFLVDSDGVLRHKVIGPLTRETWNRDVLPLVQQLQQAARP